jgi:hypothetical protein
MTTYHTPPQKRSASSMIARELTSSPVASVTLATPHSAVERGQPADIARERVGGVGVTDLRDAEVDEQLPRELAIAIGPRREAERVARPDLLGCNALVSGQPRVHLLQPAALPGEELRDPLGVPESRGAFLAGLGNAFASKLTDRLEHGEASISVHLRANEQTLFHERR